jgi:hypothetical protein
MGQKATFPAGQALSALPPEAESLLYYNLGFGPISEVRQMSLLGPRRVTKKDRLAAVSPSPISALIKQLA